MLELRVSISPTVVAERVQAVIASPQGNVRGFANPKQIELLVPASSAHFWSPQLLVNIDPDESGSSIVGHFQPNGNVWTMFMAGYAFVALSGVTGLFVGLSQWIVNQTPWALLLPPVSLVLIGAIYAAAAIGQRLGADQVDLLESALMAAIETDRIVDEFSALNS
jgi:hypothetical protein